MIKTNAFDKLIAWRASAGKKATPTIRMHADRKRRPLVVWEGRGDFHVDLKGGFDEQKGTRYRR
jgi:hypothetical protein